MPFPTLHLDKLLISLGLLWMLMQPPQAQARWAGADDAVRECMDTAKSLPKSGNQIIDTRCGLVEFEVCMHQRTGVISKSQDARRQCAMIQSLGGPGTCPGPCLAAAALPVGGSGVVDRYSGLTADATACYGQVMARLGSGNEEQDECNTNIALECLQNGSSLPTVNEAILRERKGGCRSFHRRYPKGGCVACVGDRLRVDYEAMKKTDLIPTK